jgi:hypothetical protein
LPFAVTDIDAVVARLRARGAELVGELGQYKDTFRLCYVRGPEGIIIELGSGPADAMLQAPCDLLPIISSSHNLESSLENSKKELSE